MSYRKKHIKRKINRIKPKTRFYKRAWFWVMFASLLMSGIIIYLLFFCTALNVKNITISGNEKLSAEEIETFISNNLSSKNFFLLSTTGLDKKILKQFIFAQSVKISKKFPDILNVEIVEREPIGQICNSKGCFFLDEDGIVFDRSSGEKMMVVKENPENEIEIGKPAMEGYLVALICRIQKELLKLDIETTELLVTSPLRIDAETKEKWKIYFTLDRDVGIDLQIAKLKSLLSGENMPKEKRQNLQYIDLRFKDRAYYK